VKFRPGQFAYLRIGDSPLSLDEHPFSYAGSADRRNVPKFTIKKRGGFTSCLAELPTGTSVLIDGPHGSFCPDSEATGFVMVCGGVGITPAFSLLTTLAERGDSRAHLLVVACRTPGDIPLGDKLGELAESLDRNRPRAVAAGQRMARGKRSSHTRRTPSPGAAGRSLPAGLPMWTARPGQDGHEHPADHRRAAQPRSRGALRLGIASDPSWRGHCFMRGPSRPYR